jgi:hypothetical protein
MTQDAPGGTSSPAHRAERPDVAELSAGQLVSRLSTQLSELIRDELALGRLEMQRKAKEAGLGAGFTGAGGVVAVLGLGALVAAAIAGLANVLAIWLSALIVGVVLLAIAGGLALAGRNRLRRASPPVPDAAVQGVRQDVETVKEGIRR